MLKEGTRNFTEIVLRIPQVEMTKYKTIPVIEALEMSYTFIISKYLL